MIARRNIFITSSTRLFLSRQAAARQRIGAEDVKEKSEYFRINEMQPSIKIR